MNEDFENRYRTNEAEVWVPSYNSQPEETEAIIDSLNSHDITPYVVEIRDISCTRIVVWSDEYLGMEGLSRYLQRRQKERLGNETGEFE